MYRDKELNNAIIDIMTVDREGKIVKITPKMFVETACAVAKTDKYGLSKIIARSSSSYRKKHLELLDEKRLPTVKEFFSFYRLLNTCKADFVRVFEMLVNGQTTYTSTPKTDVINRNMVKAGIISSNGTKDSDVNKINLQFTWPKSWCNHIACIGTDISEIFTGKDYEEDALFLNFTDSDDTITIAADSGKFKSAQSFGKLIEALRVVLNYAYVNSAFTESVNELDEPLYHLVPVDDYVELHNAALDSNHKTHIKDLYESNDVLNQISNADSWDSIAKAILNYTNSEREDYSLIYRFIDKNGLDTKITVQTPHYQKLAESAAQDIKKSEDPDSRELRADSNGLTSPKPNRQSLLGVKPVFDDNKSQQKYQPETVPSAYPTNNTGIPKNTTIDLSVTSFDYNKLNQLANTIPGEVRISTSTLMRPNKHNLFAVNAPTVIPRISINTNTIFSSKALKELIDSMNEDSIMLNINQTIVKNPKVKVAPVNQQIDPCDECSSRNGYGYTCPYGHSYWDDCKNSKGDSII